MKTTKEIANRIRQIEEDYKHILTGSLATIQVNAPRALEQIIVEAQLKTLHWVLGTKYKSKLEGIPNT